MKIKIAILEPDMTYLNRITAAFYTKYSDKLEIYGFTVWQKAMEELERTKIDVFLSDEFIEVDKSKIPKFCGFAYLVNSNGIDTIRDTPAIGKYQKADLIYKQILGIVSEKAETVLGNFSDDGKCKVIAFMTPSGGTGASSMAAACSMHLADGGKRVLYLNLEQLGTTGVFFSGQGQATMSDIIFALKGKKTNLSMKLESCVRQDKSGVRFFEPPAIALDLMELSTEDMLSLITEIRNTGAYEYIVIDMDFAVNADAAKLYCFFQKIVLVGDGTEISNRKTCQALKAFDALEKTLELSILDHCVLIYNKFHSKSGKIIENIPLKTIGGAPVYMQATAQQVVGQLAKRNLFDEIEKQ